MAGAYTTSSGGGLEQARADDQTQEDALSILTGSAGQKLLFFALLVVYAVALGLSAQDKMERVGQPDVGWIADLGGMVSPSRLDSSEMGLRGGGRALAINGVAVDPMDFERQSHVLAVREPGASNTIRFERWGVVHELTIPVLEWTWQDALFTHGLIDILAFLFMATAVTSFALRPYEATSWAILTLASVTGSLVTVSLLPEGDSSFHGIYLSCLAGLIPFSVLHAALAFPVVHWLIRRRSVVFAMYGVGGLHSALQVEGFSVGWWGPFRFIGTLDTILLFAAVLVFIARSTALGFRTRDPLVAQRARILLVAAILGGGPPAGAALLRDTTDWFALDMRLVYWAMAFFFLPLGYISVRQNLVNARAAARQAVTYAGVAAVLTGLGLVLVAVQAYALSLLLFPLLYWWPRFQRRLAARIYPKRARFPELLQEIGAEMAFAGERRGAARRRLERSSPPVRCPLERRLPAARRCWSPRAHARRRRSSHRE